MQAGHVTASYCASSESRLSSSQCWTFIDVSGQVKIKAAISLDAALGRLVFDLDQVQRDFADAAMKEAAN
jgi:hypothetical protein